MEEKGTAGGWLDDCVSRIRLVMVFIPGLLGELLINCTWLLEGTCRVLTRHAISVTLRSNFYFNIAGKEKYICALFKDLHMTL